MFEHIEKLKREYTDKYVVVDTGRPELARFSGQTGLIKTVNMNGRALVQFDAWNNIGWYDIELDFLKLVPKPEPKPAQEKVKEQAPKAAVASKAATIGAPGETDKDLSAPPSKPGVAAKPSTADILAAARAKAGGASTAAPAKTDAKKPSTADILAAARAKAAAPAAPAAASPPAARAVEAKVVPPAPPEPEEAPVAAAPTKKAATGNLPTTTAERIAWCRVHDAKKG